jgi:hypothetical protein
LENKLTTKVTIIPTALAKRETGSFNE